VYIQIKSITVHIYY